MATITTIGLDVAKKVFQVHGVDAEGKVVARSGERKTRDRSASAVTVLLGTRED